MPRKDSRTKQLAACIDDMRFDLMLQKALNAWANRSGQVSDTVRDHLRPVLRLQTLL
jgi:hypothetical protein